MEGDSWCVAIFGGLTALKGEWHQYFFQSKAINALIHVSLLFINSLNVF
jgi:hypothetical protein